MAQAPIQPRQRGDVYRSRASEAASGSSDKDGQNQLKTRVRFDAALSGIQAVSGAAETADLEDIKLFKAALQESSGEPGSLKSQLLGFIMPSLPPFLLKRSVFRQELEGLFESLGDEEEGEDATLFNGKKAVKRQLAMIKSLRRNSNKKIIEERVEPSREAKQDQEKTHQEPKRVNRSDF